MLALGLSACSQEPEPPTESPMLYIGTFPDGNPQGVYAYRFDPETGVLSVPEVATPTEQPSFLALHPSHQVLYAVNEISDYQDDESGAVSAFTIDYETGILTELNQVSTHGAQPCYLTTDRSGQWLFVANYAGGSVAVFPIDVTGGLGESTQLLRYVGSGRDPERQASPHPHAVTISEDNRYLYVSDLGLDRIYIHRFNVVTGQLLPSDPAFVQTEAGAGPRHLTFAPGTDSFYGINELNNTVTVYDMDPATGRLTAVQTLSTLAEGFTGENTAAEIAVSSQGFVYASNRGEDSIAIFRRNPADGRLTPAGRVPSGGKTPRSFALSPDERFLYVVNQESNSLTTFAVGEDGGLTPIGTLTDVTSPSAVLFAEPPVLEDASE